MAPELTFRSTTQKLPLIYCPLPLEIGLSACTSYILPTQCMPSFTGFLCLDAETGKHLQQGCFQEKSVSRISRTSQSIQQILQSKLR